MGDVAQILGGLGGSGGNGSATSGPNDAVAKELEHLKPTGGAVARGKPKKPKKLTGMQREVLELLESNHRVNHALYPGANKLTLQQKWKERKDRPAVNWLRKAFHNPARAELAGEQEPMNGGLTLTHWVKAHIDPVPEYVFSRFNIKCDVVRYSDDEYDAVLANHVDPLVATQWTREESDLLMALCDRHDLRWIVIADKYNTHAIAKAQSKDPRSVEDIKYRYYEVARLVSEYRDRVESTATAETKKGAKEVKPEQAPMPPAVVAVAAEGVDPLSAMPTNPPAEASAKLPPPPASVKAEAAAGHVLPSSTEDTSATPSRYYRFNIVYERHRKRQLEQAFTRSMEDENEVRRLTEELRVVEQQLKKVSVKVDPKKKHELADLPYKIHREYPKGVFLRSQTLALPSQQQTSSVSQKSSSLSAKMLKKMDLLLDEMGIPQRPMPTKLACELFDTLRQDAVGLLSLRKHLAAKQMDVQALKDRYMALSGKEYTPVTPVLPTRKTARRGDTSATAAAAIQAGAAGGAMAGTDAATPAAQISKGKSLKTAEKQFRVSNKRRGSTATPGVPSKKNKKQL